MGSTDLTKTLPRISIVTPSFNQGKYLEKTILSVFDQGYPNLEYIIIDGGSSDESVEIIKKYADRLTYWVSEPDRGQSHAINKGFERATGEIYGWLNSDDWYHPGALQTVAEAFAANPEAGAVVGAGEMVDETGNILHHDAPDEVTVAFLYHWLDRYFMQPSCFFKADAWKICGPLKEQINFAMDLDLWLNIASRYKFVVCDETFSTSLIHSSAKTKALAVHSIIDAIIVLVRHGDDRNCREKMEYYLQDLFNKEKLLADKENMILGLIAERDNVMEDRELIIKDRERIIEDRERMLYVFQNSLSWRITQPLRAVAKIVRSVVGKGD